jgi:four helix bundle protein
MKDERRAITRASIDDSAYTPRRLEPAGKLQEGFLMEADLRRRTKAFALRIIKLYSALPKRGPAQVIATQVLRSGTSPGAQYREACRAKSDADFISKIEGALQELDETQYWLELIADGKILPHQRLESLHKEAEELIAIFVTIVRRVKSKQRLRRR